MGRRLCGERPARPARRRAGTPGRAAAAAARRRPSGDRGWITSVMASRWDRDERGAMLVAAGLGPSPGTR